VGGLASDGQHAPTHGPLWKAPPVASPVPARPALLLPDCPQASEVGTAGP